MAMIQKKSNGDYLEDVSIISKGVNIEGKLKSDGNVRIDGIIRGDVLVQGNLTLGETSEVTGEIKAENITLSGKIIGTVSANEKLVLEAKAVLKGDMIAKILVVEPGARFDGKCSMTNETEV
ncbi:MAG: polymer-forming cytoskeletal protein [Ignavibacteriales bacterium]|nr:polymer-forming cytoskeletal protein [Ignavibacteriales bacterium]